MAAHALREVVGLGALEALLGRAGVREIVVEGPEQILVDAGEGLAPTDESFSSSGMLTVVARRLAARAGVTDVEGPVLKGFLPEGGQVTVVQAPLAVGGPYVEVRRQAAGPELAGLVSQGVLDEAMADVLEKAVRARKNVAVIGPAGAAVTTLLGALASLAAEDERVVVVAPTPDVAVRRDHVVRLRVGQADFAGVLREAVQLRSDRLVVDGVGAADGYAALVAMASSGEGALAGFHAATDDDAAAALRLYGKLGGAAEGAVGGLVMRAAHVVVQIAPRPEGWRVVGVTEFARDEQGGPISLDLFRYAGGVFESGASASFAS
ncbi:MAG: ATPase, T2SS/T4P/T4SS family [Myxococcota bacterium]